MSPYKRQNFDEEEGFEYLNADQRIDKLISLVIGIDRGLDDASGTLLQLYKEVESNTGVQDMSTQMLEQRLDSAGLMIGERPQSLKSDYVSLSIWGTISAIASKIDEFEVSSSQSSTVSILFQAKRELQEDFNKRTLLMEGKTLSLKTTLINATKMLSESIQANSIRMERLEREQDRNAASMLPFDFKKTTTPDAAPGPWASDLVRTFEGKLEELEVSVRRLASSGGNVDIKFNGLGFEDFSQANAWLEINVVDPDAFGMICDPGMLMEHVQVNISGRANMPKLEKLYKLKLETLSQGIAMSSFEVAVPRFFSGSSSHTVNDDNSSCFDTISSWKLWDNSRDGFRKLLRKELAKVKRTQEEGINLQLRSGTQAKLLATLSLSESVAFIEGMITFIYSYYNHLTQAKFGSRKAFHVTTQLASKLWEAAAEPRNGAMQLFRAGDAKQIGQTIFWSVLKSLDVAKRIMGNNFEDDELVSAELVKFLSINTGFEAIEQLEKRVEVFERELKESQSSLKLSSPLVTEKKFKSPILGASNLTRKSPNEESLPTSLGKRIRTRPSTVEGLARPPSNQYAASNRDVEVGYFKVPTARKFTLDFETVPIWLLGLEKKFVQHLYLRGFESVHELRTHLEAKAPHSWFLVEKALARVGDARISFIGNKDPLLDSTILASGSIDYIKDRSNG